MKSLAGVLAASFLALAATMALADETSGTVAAIDATAMTLTLDDGTTYTLPSSFDPGSVQEGDSVAITYTVENGQNVATTIAPSE